MHTIKLKKYKSIIAPPFMGGFLLNGTTFFISKQYQNTDINPLVVNTKGFMLILLQIPLF